MKREIDKVSRDVFDKGYSYVSTVVPDFIYKNTAEGLDGFRWDRSNDRVIVAAIHNAARRVEDGVEESETGDR